MSASTSIEHHEEQNDKQLWAAVIGTAIEDATSLRTNTRAQREKREALDWLLHDGHDFTLVCSLAGLDPEAVRDRMKRLIERHQPGVVEKFQNTAPDRTFSSTQESTKLEFSAS